MALVSAALLFVGVYLPIICIPIGSMSYMANESGEGAGMLILAAGAVFLTLRRSTRLLWIPAVIAIIMLICFWGRMHQMTAGPQDSDFERGMAISLSIGPGFAVMLIGAVGLIGAAMMRPTARPARVP